MMPEKKENENEKQEKPFRCSGRCECIRKIYRAARRRNAVSVPTGAATVDFYHFADVKKQCVFLLSSFYYFTVINRSSKILTAIMILIDF